MITLVEEQLYQMLTIFFGVAEWTPSDARIAEVAKKLGEALICAPQTRASAVGRFAENVNGRRDFLRRGGRLS